MQRAAFFIALVPVLAQSAPVDPKSDSTPESVLPESVIRNVQRIIDYHLPGGGGHHEVYDWLANFVDTVGHRKAGTQNYMRAVDYVTQQLQRDGHSGITKEDVPIPVWIRGQDSATMTQPYNRTLDILTLGDSVPTPKNGIHAEVVVAYDLLHLRSVCESARGKILLFDQPWVKYSVTVTYRYLGAQLAAECGAVAVLIKSVTPLSVYSPHTGIQSYNYGQKKIPSVSVTVEDAELIARLVEQGKTVKVLLKVESHSKQQPYVQMDPNVVVELPGSEKPEEIVLIGAHLDSWDVGQGAMDNGGGVALVRQALHTLKTLGIKPKRTIRGILFANEESGYYGSKEHHRRHLNESIIFATESDTGAFGPQGYRFAGTAQQRRSMQAVMPLFSRINASNLDTPKWTGIDTQFWIKDGIAGGTIDVTHRTEYYFTFHHSRGDTMSLFQRDGSMERAAALQTGIAYIIADADEEHFPW